MSADKFILIFDQIDNTQRALIHERVKDLADSWWHELLDVWVVEGGDSVSAWRDHLAVFVPQRPSKLVVFRLSDVKPRWAARFTSMDWFSEH